MQTVQVDSTRAPARREPFAELCARLSAGKPETARVSHEGTVLFGPTMRVERFRLGNGLKVLLLEDHAAPVICLQTWFDVGSRHERDGKTGISHLFEHLMFGETEDEPHGSFDRLLEEAGADTNAATFLDWTYYHMNLPKQALGLALRLESQRMSRLVLQQKQVDSEIEVVANERRQRVDDDVDGSVSELLYATAFDTHGYRIPTIGWMADIKAFTPADCEAFYRTYYAPNNATLVLVGDLAIEEGLASVQAAFGARPPSDLPVEDVKPEPPQTAERRASVVKPTATHKVAIGYKSPALGDFDHAPLTLLAEILFGGRSSRAHKLLVQEREIATEVRGWVGSFRDPSLFDVFASARGEHTSAELLSALDEVFEGVVREPVSEAELQRAKARLELGVLQGLESASGKAEQLGFYEVVLGDPAALFTKVDAYRRATRADLLRVARRYLVRSSRTVVEVAPDPDFVEGDEDEEEEGDS